MAISLYRKYRPNTFEEVVGQEHVKNTLANAVSNGEVAHAYLFCGPRGTGKTTSARLLAKALLCEHGPTPKPDGTCAQCAEIANGTHPDVYELDAASRTGVENVREEIISRVQFAPTRGRYKVYIIDEVHMLSSSAFNALLKTFEEPPEHVIFIMCTTDPHKVPETIQSRCQRFDFRRLSIDEICSYLRRICSQEGFEAEQEALEFIAAKAAGGMRDATTALEQVAVSNNGAITLQAAQGQLGQTDAEALFELCGYIAARDTANSFLWLNRAVEVGVDLTQTARDVAVHVRNLYVAALTGGVNGIIACPVNDLARYQSQAAAFGGVERLNRALCVCGDLLSELRGSTDARLSFELALAKLCRAESELTLEALAERIESLEAGIAAPKLSGDLLSAMASQAVASAAATAGMKAPSDAGADVAVRSRESSLSQDPVGAATAVAAGEEHVQTGPEDEEWIPEEEWAPEEEAGLPWEDDPAIATTRMAAPEPAAEAAVAPDLSWDIDSQPEPQSMSAGSVPFGVGSLAASAAAPAAAPAFEKPAGQNNLGSSDGAFAASTEPVATVAANGQSMSPARLMAALHAYVKREDVATDALLNGVEVEHDAQGYHLLFPASNGFAMTLVSHGAAHDLLSAAFQEVLGAPTGFDCKAAGGGAKKRSNNAPVFEAVSAEQAAAPAQEYDDGYLDAQDAYYGGYDEGYDDYASIDSPAAPDPMPAPSLQDGFDPAAYMRSVEEAAVPVEEENAPAVPDFSARPVIDEVTKSGLEDTLSVFGGGIKFEEI